MPKLRLLLEGLQHPEHLSVPGSELYRTALDMCRWADERGFDEVLVSEHHQSEDNYLSAPLVFAAAVGAVTSRIRLHTAILLAPLYHPIRLAEDIAVADLCLGGRLDLGLGIGYVEADFPVFDADFHRRGKALDELIPVLRQAWTGEPFEFRGQQVRVRPRPVQDPMPIRVGGGSQRGIERAVTLADGFSPPGEEAWEQYRRLVVERGGADPGPATRGPDFMWVTTEPKDEVWQRLVPFIRHHSEAYSRWNPTGPPGGAFPTFDYSTPSGNHQVLHPDEVLALADDLGPTGTISLSPLMGGIHPSEGRAMLDTFDRHVLPALNEVRAASV